jgi:hypothetical protein
MIGTHFRARAFAAFTILALAAVGLSFAWGCNDLPVSAPGVGSGSEVPSHHAVPGLEGMKPGLTKTTGTVDEIDYSAMRLRVAGLWFRADGETEIETDTCKSTCSLSDVVAGDAVKVKHEQTADADGSYYAREIEVENENDEEEPEDPEVDEAETAGTVDAVDGSSFQVAGVWFWTDAATVFELDDGCADRSIAVGDRVKVEHSTLDTAGFGFYAFRVEIDRGCEADGDDDEEVEEE